MCTRGAPSGLDDTRLRRLWRECRFGVCARGALEVKYDGESSESSSERF